MKVTLAIPNYNGAANLAHLLPRVLEEDFAAVYVLDDCSTDDSVAVAERFSSRVTLIQGTENVGAGGNRNRLIEHVSDGIIMFLDADMDLVTRGVSAKVTKLFKTRKLSLSKQRPVYMVGGLILTKNGERVDWNFGPEMHPVRDARAAVYLAMAESFAGNEELREYVYRHALPYSRGWRVFDTAPAELVVDWIAEGSFCVRADIFAEIGGYDTRMRYHETHDLSRRIRDKGGVVKFSPEIVARHLDLDVRGERRREDKVSAQLYFYQKHWGMSEEVFWRLREKG